MPGTGRCDCRRYRPKRHSFVLEWGYGYLGVVAVRMQQSTWPLRLTR